MITHVVLFRLKDRSPASVEATARVLRDMDGKIEQLRGLEVGVDRLGSPRSYDIALIAKFDSMEDLNAYQVHPVHQKVVEHMKQAAETSVSVDYES